MKRWQEDRVTQLRGMALQVADEIGTLLALKPEALRNMAACFGRRFDFLDPHRDSITLRGARIAAYAPRPGTEECPKCWVTNGYRTPLVLREAFGGVDITVCPRCTFCELLPNGENEGKAGAG